MIGFLRRVGDQGKRETRSKETKKKQKKKKNEWKN